MADLDPYRPPTHDADVAPYVDPDGADAFVDMLPTPQVRAAGIASIMTGVATLFVAIQFVIGLRPSGVVSLILAMLVIVGVAWFGVAWGIAAARAWGAVAGIALAIVTGGGVAVLFLLTGASSCIMAGLATIVTLVLLVVSASDVRRMARARSSLTRAAR